MLIELSTHLINLRWDLRLLAEEGSLPKNQIVDILLDFGSLGADERAVANFVLFKLHPSIQAKGRSFLTWDEVDEALSELEDK